MQTEEDLLTPLTTKNEFTVLADGELAILEQFLVSSGTYQVNTSNLLPFLIFSPMKVFRRFCQMGVVLRQANAFPSFKVCMDILTESYDECAWIAKIGLCHGLLTKRYNKKICADDYSLLNPLLSDYTLPFILRKKFRRIALHMCDSVPRLSRMFRIHKLLGIP